MENTQVKQGRGRPKGTKNYVKMNKSQVVEILSKCETMPVSQKWLKAIGIDPSGYEDMNPAEIIAPRQIAEEEKVEFTLEK